MQQAEIRNQRNNCGGRGSGRGGYNNSSTLSKYLFYFLLFLERGGFRKSYLTKDQ